MMLAKCFYVTVPFELDDPVRALQQKVEKSETTMNLKFWHDHATVGNHSTLLCTVSFLYNTSVYLTPEECGM